MKTRRNEKRETKRNIKRLNLKTQLNKLLYQVQQVSRLWKITYLQISSLQTLIRVRMKELLITKLEATTQFTSAKFWSTDTSFYKNSAGVTLAQFGLPVTLLSILMLRLKSRKALVIIKRQLTMRLRSLIRLARTHSIKNGSLMSCATKRLLSTALRTVIQFSYLIHSSTLEQTVLTL
jgi:hypothetical protein